MKDLNNYAILYDLNVLDYINIEKALIFYSSECSYLNKDNVEKTLVKIKKIIGR